MALTVETGTGSASSDAYISRADATTYHGNRENTAWTDATAEEQDAAIRRATDYIGETYRLGWAGTRVSTTQALDWPRYNVPRRDVDGSLYASTVVPGEVVRACAELALRALSGPLRPDQAQAVKSLTAGSVSVTYADYSNKTKTYPAIDRLLAPLLSGGGGLMLLRA